MKTAEIMKHTNSMAVSDLFPPDHRRRKVMRILSRRQTDTVRQQVMPGLVILEMSEPTRFQGVLQ